jgi:CRISPR-associated protein Cas5d
MYAPLEVYVWGKFACFTRPEMKVERVSYEVMTPSAARGVLESIFWKPEFYWQIREIQVLKPIRFFSILRDVAYSIAASVVVRPGVEEDEAKYRDQFQRRVKRGQCHTMPYLGCREFTANFGLEPPADRDTRLQEIAADLGQMLFDLDYEENGSGRGTPRFFHARLNGGVLRIPGTLYNRGEE